MAVRVQKGGWLVIFLLGVALIGYTLHRYGFIDLGKWMPGGSGGSGAVNSANVILRIHGSNTIGATLAPALAQEFLRQQGATKVTTIPQDTDVVVVQGDMP